MLATFGTGTTATDGMVFGTGFWLMANGSGTYLPARYRNQHQAMHRLNRLAGARFI
jgi:hypothetical protein